MAEKVRKVRFCFTCAVIPLYVRGNTSVVHAILLILKTNQFAKKFTDKNRPLLLTADRILSPRCIPSPTMFVRLAALAVLRAI